MLTMAAEFSQQAVLDFLMKRGARVKNTDLIDHFRNLFPAEPEKKANLRETFKSYIDNIAFVKTVSGVKYVCVKKKFRGSLSLCEPGSVLTDEHREPTGPARAPTDSRRVRVEVEEEPALQNTPPVSGYGNHSQVTVPHVSTSAPCLMNKGHDSVSVCVVEEVASSSGEMGNTSFSSSFSGRKRNSEREQAGRGNVIPEIAVIEASPLPGEETVFTLPGPVQTGSTRKEDSLTAEHHPTHRRADMELEDVKEADQVIVMSRLQTSNESKQRFVSTQPESDNREDQEQLDVRSLCDSEGNTTPKGSRKHFIEVMMNSSPQVRRSLVLRSSVYMSSRSDSDSASLVSSTLDDDGASITLDPLEHEWMMCASDGEWASLYQLLVTEPSLVLRKDFITGFTCLHWAAKHGKPELIALIINFAKHHNVPISVDVRSNSGYTPLHIAAMHNHMEVVKLLVGAYDADVEIRDYSGKKACQYLTDDVGVDLRDIIGEYCHTEDSRVKGRWRFSKVLQSNLKPVRLLSPSDSDSVDGESHPRDKLPRRKSSLSRMKPKLQRLRKRTSQIIHSTSLWDTEEQEGSKTGSFKSRPKTHFFG